MHWCQVSAEALLSTFFGFTFLCVQLPKSITKCFLKKGFFSAHFAMNLWSNNRPVHVNEWNQTKTKQKKKVSSYSYWPQVLLFYLTHKQCSIIKGWLYCLSSESKGRFLANKLLAWWLVMTEIQFSLIKNIKIGCPGHSLTPHPSMSDNIIFLSYLPTPRSGCHMYITPKAWIGNWLTKF